MRDGWVVERRKNERTKCRFRCELASVTGVTEAVAVDISEGGLAVRSPKEAHQGEAVEVRLSVPGRGLICLEALVWHVRAARSRQTGENLYLLGLMLSKVPDAYLDLASGSRPKAKPLPDVGPLLEPEEPPDLEPFRVRLKHRSSPRTRVLCVDASSQVEACALARQELGVEWEIIEARTKKR